MQSKASFIVPAYNEEFRIRGLLQTLTEPSIANRCAVFVVCNGCTDRTSEVAREYVGVRVTDISTMGKHHALNEGDRLAGDHFPRFYCDADVTIDITSVGRLIDYLEGDEPKAAGPNVSYGVTGRPWSVRRYYAALDSVPVIVQWRVAHLAGRGIYGANRAARALFTVFPPLLADDMFFDSQFDERRKSLVPMTTVTLDTPRSLRELIRNEARVVQANRELADFVRTTERDGAVDTSTSERRDPRVAATDPRVRRLSGINVSNVVPLAVYAFVEGMARAHLRLLDLRRRSVNWR